MLATIQPLKRALDEPSLPGGGAGSALAGYLLTRAGDTPAPQRRRRVVTVRRGPNALAHAQARIVSLPANFGRTRRSEADATAPSIAPQPTETPEATEPELPPARTGRRGLVSGLAAGACVLGALSAWWWTQRVEPPAVDPSSAVVDARPDGGASEGAPAPAGGLRFEVSSVAPIVGRGGVILRGALVNGTPEAFATVRVQATLLLDEAPARRRTVWCCDVMDATEAGLAVNNPRHAHYAHAAKAPEGVALAPGQTRPFVVLFPGLGKTTEGADLGAEIKLTTPEPTN